MDAMVRNSFIAFTSFDLASVLIDPKDLILVLWATCHTVTDDATNLMHLKKYIKVSRVLYWPQIKPFFFLESSTGGNFLNSKAAVATKGNIPHKDTGHSGLLKLYLLHIFKEVTGRLRRHTPFKRNSGEFKHLTCSCRMWTPPFLTYFSSGLTICIPSVIPLPQNTVDKWLPCGVAHLHCVHSWVAERNTTGSFSLFMCVCVLWGRLKERETERGR